MIRLGYDLENVKEKSSFELPPGTYEACVVKAELGTSKAGSRMLKVTVEVTSGEYEGCRLNDFIPLDSEAAAWRLKSFLKGLYGQPPMGSEIPEPQEYEGRNVKILVGYENSPTGERRPRIRSYSRAEKKEEEFEVEF